MELEERQDIHRNETSQIPSTSNMTSSKDNLLPKTSELRIMLIGSTGDDKTEIMNALRNSDENRKNSAPRESAEVSIPSQKENLTIGGQKITVVDTPGLCDAEKKDQEVMKEIKKCLSQVGPGPHAFLFVLPLEPFTAELQNMVEIFKSSFSDYVLQYTMVVFVEELKRQTIEDFISDNDKLKKFVYDDCKKKYHHVPKPDDQPEVKKLVQKIQEMVKENNHEYYTAEKAKKWKTIALAINGSALAGAAIGGVTAQSVSSAVTLVPGLAIGAVGGGVAGAVGCIVVARAKKAGCVLQ